eukprot:TRINITY_DN22250_c0_g1_i2.p2 TRINITY_DN22250_c0_g1~~TRINITY_DN22250_c0_g1_i2.p2  ORF type:complete len:115 (-),score=4.80 TRINITY_DN22250_c0_g1_i2:404-748(-)
MWSRRGGRKQRSRLPPCRLHYDAWRRELATGDPGSTRLEMFPPLHPNNWRLPRRERTAVGFSLSPSTSLIFEALWLFGSTMSSMASMSLAREIRKPCEMRQDLPETSKRVRIEP